MPDELRELADRYQDRAGLWLGTALSYATVFLLGLALGRGEGPVWYYSFGVAATAVYLFTKHRSASKIRQIYLQHLERTKASSV